jgi:hypothetical protein
MRKLVLMSIVSLFMATGAGAHIGELNVVQFPDNALPVIDGNLNEWALVPPPFQTTNEDFPVELIGQFESDPSDLNIKIMWGYNPNNDRIYFAAEIFDDWHERDSEMVYQDDVLEIIIDGDHSFGDAFHPSTAAEVAEADQETKDLYANRNNQEFWLAVPEFAGTTIWQQWGQPKKWLAEPPTLDFAYSFDGEEIGEATYYYELAFSPYDDALIERAGSTQSDLEEGGYVHVVARVPDFDGPVGDFAANGPPNTQYDGYWITSLENFAFGVAGLPDGFLAPLDDSITAVESESWGRLKARFH